MGLVKLDSEIKGECGNINIPFGYADVFSIDSQPNDDNKSLYISVKPKVFTEASLDKSKAKSAQFQVLGNDEKPVSNLNGFYYIFVNGYLWREIAAVDNGCLSEVDLANEFGKNERSYSGLVTQTILLPKKINGLNCEPGSLSEPSVQVAFSIAQWSWQYIVSLGGFYKDDPRQKSVNAKAPTYVEDQGLADSLRNARCQQIDLAAAESEGQITIHDPGGIALSLLNKCQMIFLQLQIENKKLTDKKHYDSGVLAYQAMLNDDLHEKVMRDHYIFPHRTSMTPIKTKKEGYADLSSGAKFLRSGAKHLDKDYLESYLSSDKLEQLLEELPIAQKELVDFLQDLNNDSPLTSKQSDYIGLAPVMNDWVALENVDYLFGFNFITNVLNILSIDDVSTGVFRPWKEKLPAENERKNNINKATSAIESFLKNTFEKGNWLSECFMIPEGHFDISIPGSVVLKTLPKEKNNGEAKFRFEEFKRIHEKLIEEKQEQEPLLANKTLKEFFGKAKDAVGYLTAAWGRVASQYQNGVLKPHTVKIRNLMVSYNKALGVSDFADIHIKQAGAVLGDNPSVIGITNYKRTQNNRQQRRAMLRESVKNPPPNAVTIYDSKENVIASEDPKSFGSNKGYFNPKNWTDYNDLIGRYDSIEGELVVVPKAHRYAKAYDNPDFKLGAVDTVKLKGVRILEHNLPMVMLAFEMFNANEMIKKFKAGERLDLKFALDSVNIVFSLASLSVEAASFRLSKVSIFLASEVDLIIRTVQVTKIVGAFGLVLTLTITALDVYKSIRKNDMDAAFFHALSGAVAIAGFIYLGAALFTTPLGWAIIAVGLIIAIIAILVTDNELETWGKNGPFAKDIDDRCTGSFKKWYTQPKECYAALVGALMKPSVTLGVKRLTSTHCQLTIDIDTPNFALGQSEVFVQVYQIEDEGVLHFEQEFRRDHKNWQITQKEDTQSGAITGFKYTLPILSMWPKHFEVDWQVKVQYRLDKNVTLPYVNIDERNDWEDGEVPDKAWIIKEVEYA
ncbi:hypothetical protein [Pseudoalteromonas sp. SR41-1]|uniref:hypothetical protein n=1 Tax=Pseudoalteromonas sp. SR41-1 TaxID=2760952 RepID=UPI001602205B|nr:hypothetical protein [Pseudoalteromonas sp. SR41-1]MBB1279080.1 hypothetical protein [Pseudoalteromonas sp. SR41-1]